MQRSAAQLDGRQGLGIGEQSGEQSGQVGPLLGGQHRRDPFVEGPYAVDDRRQCLASGRGDLELDEAPVPGALPDWNPAFSDVRADGPVVVGVAVPIRVQRLLSGTLTYERMSPDSVVMEIRIPGLTEHGSWSMRAAEGGTVVSHEFTQRGPLANLLEPATRDVAHLRVDRLRARLDRRL